LGKPSFKNIEFKKFRVNVPALVVKSHSWTCSRVNQSRHNRRNWHFVSLNFINEWFSDSGRYSSGLFQTNYQLLSSEI